MDFVRYDPPSTPHDWMIVWITYNDHNYGVRFNEEQAQHPMGIVAVFNDTFELSITWTEAAHICQFIRKCVFELHKARDAARAEEASHHLALIDTVKVTCGVKPR